MLLQQNLDLTGQVVPLVSRYTDLFDRMIVVDYYDGPMAGVGQTEKDCSIYEFQLLDQSENADIRIMRLTRLPYDSFDQLVSIYSHAEAPCWPTWHIGCQNPDEYVVQQFDSALAEFRKIASIPDYIIAWRNSDNVILSIKAMDSSLWNNIGYKSGEWDWFGFLGLEIRI